MLDKDVIILKNQKDRIDLLEGKMEQVTYAISENKNKVNEIKSDIEKIYELTGIKPYSCSSKPSKPSYDNREISVEDTDYNTLYEESKIALKNNEIDIYNLTYEDLLEPNVIREIEEQLNRPVERREKWSNDDKVIVIAAVIVGSIADMIFSNRTNKLTGSGYKAKITDGGWEFQKSQDSNFSKWLNNFHIHDKGSPIDFQGKDFGGGLHRQLSKGHDLFRAIETIINIKNGRFEGVVYRNGVATKVVEYSNQYGTPYNTMSTIEAIGNYLKHMKGDFFSTHSLPIPGYSFFREASNRDLRIFSANMYKAGFNLKNVAIQGISTLSIELILRIYMAVKETERIKQEGKSFNILEDYSNIDNIKSVINSAANPKYREMFLLAHSLVTAVNIGKVIIKKAPWEINITEIIMTVRYFIPFIKDYLYRNSTQAILDRNTAEIITEWEDMLMRFEDYDKGIPMPNKVLIIE